MRVGGNRAGRATELRQRAAVALSLLQTVDLAIVASGCETVADVRPLLAGMISAAEDASR